MLFAPSVNSDGSTKPDAHNAGSNRVSHRRGSRLETPVSTASNLERASSAANRDTATGSAVVRSSNVNQIHTSHVENLAERESPGVSSEAAHDERSSRVPENQIVAETAHVKANADVTSAAPAVTPTDGSAVQHAQTEPHIPKNNNVVLSSLLFGEHVPCLFHDDENSEQQGADDDIFAWMQQRNSIGEMVVNQQPVPIRFERFRAFLFRSGLAPLLAFALRLLYDEGKHTGQWPEDAMKFLRTRIFALTDDKFLMKHSTTISEKNLSRKSPVQTIAAGSNYFSDNANRSGDRRRSRRRSTVTGSAAKLHELEEFERRFAAATQLNHELRMHKLRLVLAYKQMRTILYNKRDRKNQLTTPSEDEANTSSKKKRLGKKKSMVQLKQAADQKSAKLKAKKSLVVIKPHLALAGVLLANTDHDNPSLLGNATKQSIYIADSQSQSPAVNVPNTRLAADMRNTGDTKFSKLVSTLIVPSQTTKRLSK